MDEVILPHLLLAQWRTLQCITNGRSFYMSRYTEIVEEPPQTVQSIHDKFMTRLDFIKIRYRKTSLLPFRFASEDDVALAVGITTMGARMSSR